MKASDFFEGLRKIIREEVQLAVRTEVKSLLQEQRKITKAPIKEDLDSQITKLLENERKKSSGTVLAQKTSKKQYVKDPMLNEILNNTVVEKGFGDDPDGAMPDVQPLDESTLPKEMQFAGKDYSAILKKSLQKSAQKHGK